MVVEVQALRASLSYSDIERYTGWLEPAMINDYIGIGQNSAIIATQINQNTVNIAENTENIAENADNIADNTNTIDAHIADDSAHGVTGVNVGTEDFCTQVVGGVVFLAGLVADAVDSTAEVTIPDVGIAPIAYSDVYAQQQTDLLNDIKDKHNTLLADLNNAITQFNELLANMKTARQMDT
ncbi:hypothetical protein KAR91_84675 [Candidatus Pacearchaeota archaeon]|nr:hypothetical protein [Candidatus Pacearchaeota archaeon]